MSITKQISMIFKKILQMSVQEWNAYKTLIGPHLGFLENGQKLLKGVKRNNHEKLSIIPLIRLYLPLTAQN